MKPRIYITRLIPQAGIELLKETCEVEINPEDRPLTREELLARVADKDGVIGLMSDRIDAGFFDAARRLRGYANYAVGYDNIDVPEATRRGIPVTNTPGVLTLATAELVLWAGRRRQRGHHPPHRFGHRQQPRRHGHPRRQKSPGHAPGGAARILP
jgi:glyoxylate reductase